MPVKDWFDYLTPEGQRRFGIYDTKIRNKRDAPKWGLCWLYGKIMRPIKFLRWDERVTTIGSTIWIVDRFNSADPLGQAQTIEHELHHISQLRNWLLWYPLSYVLVLPIGLSMRGVWECAAFLRGYKLAYRYTKESPEHFADRLTNCICGRPYLYALWLVKPLVRKVVLSKACKIAGVK